MTSESLPRQRTVWTLTEIMHGEIQGVHAVVSSLEEAQARKAAFDAEHSDRWTLYIEEWEIDGERRGSVL